MKYFPYIFFLALLSAVGSGCGNRNNPANQRAENASDSEKADIRYAQGFEVSQADGFTLIDVKDPSGESELTYKYALIEKGQDKNKVPAGYEAIHVPVQSVICMTSLQLSNFIKRGAPDRIVGISSTRFRFNEAIRERLAENKMSKIGIEGEFDSELVMALDPDIILVSPFKRGGYETIRNLDIPLISFLGYKETTPLGQAEWIKFTALLLGMEVEGNRLFKEIETRYNELKSRSDSVANRPVVLSGELHSGNWYVVGGNSYLAQLFRDAGADYFLQNDNESGGYYVDFETVYSQGADADYWRVVNSFNGTFDYEAFRQADARYADFKAFREKKVIYCNLREKPFYENTPVEPEVVLADLIHIFHPTILPDHTPVYYQLLEP
ncbi:MAG: ABC transporter substrate-binding protein [Rikenellaceae bacterium]|nr:ABC transporter substrate-binding protein [Rikenellaceae bacterium]